MGKSFIKKRRFDVEDGESMCCGLCYCSRTQKRICCTLIWTPIVVVLGLLITLLIKAAIVEERFHLKQLSDDSPDLIGAGQEEQLEWAKLLGGAVKLQTVSTEENQPSVQELLNLLTYLHESFPGVFKSEHVAETIVNEYSILLRITGSEPTGNPYLLAAHLDVVPAGDVDGWDLDPFLGEVVNQDGADYIYGRGCIDDKHSVIGILIALDRILREGGQPRRTFYIAFGHDEEVNGGGGAGHMAPLLADMLQEHGETLDFLLDEGMFVMQDMVPGMEDPVAYIGVVEKGWAMLELTAEGVQGHSSTPPKESAIGILSRALANLEQNPHPSRFRDGPEYDSMSYLAPHATFLYKIILSNLWLLSGAIAAVLSGDSSTDAIQRTTTAITMIQGGIKENVMPNIAKATVNHRIHPTSNLEEVLQHNREVIDDDRVQITVKDYFPPPKVSPYSDESMPFQTIANSAVQVFSTAHVTPGTLVANTDTKHYLNLTDNVYRFTPTFAGPSDTARYHGLNERISVENFNQVVEFYYRLIRNADYLVKRSSGAAILEGSADGHVPEGSGDGEVEAGAPVEDYSLVTEDT